MSSKKIKSYVALLLIACVIFGITYAVYLKYIDKYDSQTTEPFVINNNEEYIDGITTTVIPTTLILTTHKDFTMNRTTVTKSNKVNSTKPTKVTEKETTEPSTTKSTSKSTTIKETIAEKHTEAKNTTKTSTSTSYSVPNNGGKFKSYTNYKLLNKNSSQWTKVQCNNNAYTDSNGLRKVGDYYCVAMGSYYTNTLGDLFEIKTENGSFKVIICDFKANAHTDSKNQYTVANGCIIEFYVDMPTLNSRAKTMGDISYIGGKFAGKIISIVKIGNYFT